MNLFMAIGLCACTLAHCTSTYQEVPSRLAMMEFGDPSAPPILPSFIDESISINFISAIRGAIREIDEDNEGDAVYGKWNMVLVQKLAVIAFLTGHVLPPPVTPISRDLKVTLWFTDECMDVFNTSICNAPYAMAKFMDVVWGNGLKGQAFPASKATVSGAKNAVDAAKLASLKMVPQIGYASSASSLDDKIEFPTYMRTRPSRTNQARAIAIYLKRLNNYTRIDTLSCDTTSDRSQMEETSESFRENGMVSNYILYFAPGKHTTLPPSMMSAVSYFAAGADVIAKNWADNVAALKENNAHVHIMQMSDSCPGYDIMHYVAMNNLVGAGHLWLGGGMATSSYEELYLKSLRYQMPAGLGFISPYAFQLPLDGYIQVKEAASTKLTDFFQWLMTLESLRSTLFEPWLLQHVPAGVFANATTSRKWFWGEHAEIGRAFDAMWTCLLAINSLMDKVGSMEFTPQELLIESRKQHFQGLSGLVRFNETSGDRIADYMFMQYRYSSGRRLSIKMPSPSCAENATTKKFDASLIAVQCSFPAAGSEYQIAAFAEDLVVVSAPVFFGGSIEPPSNLNKLCQLGESYNVVTGKCDTCPPGTFNDKRGQASCDPCRPGFFSDAFGSPHCKGCAEGTITTQTRSTICKKCSAGTYANLVSQSVCFNCSAGQYSDAGFEECEACPTGKYQNAKGQAKCIDCNDIYPGTSSDQAAKNAEQCYCKKGQYYRTDIGCTTCDKGLDCPKGRAIPLQMEGFYVEILDAHTRQYDVFECQGKDWCPKGALATCNHPRIGRGCAVIGAKKCPPYLIFVLPVAVTIVIYLAYRATANAQYGKVSSMMILAGNLGIAVAAMQAVNVYTLLYDKVPDELAWLMQVGEVFMFRWQGVFPECNVGSTFSARLSLSIFPPLAVIGASAFNFAITNILGKTVLGKLIPPMKYSLTWNCAGMLLQVMYITQCKDAFSYFASKPNPCGKDTLMDFSDVIFWSDEHVGIVPILTTVYLWLFYVVGTYSVFVYTVMTAKSHLNNQLFWQKWKFMFARWRPETLHWGLWMLLRNLCIALVPIVVRTDAHVYRVLVFVSLVGGHALLEAYYVPWMSYMNNAFEILISVVLCAMAIVGMGFEDSATDDQKTIASCVMMFLMACIWVGFISAFFYALKWASPKATATRQKLHKEAANALVEKCVGVFETINGDDELRTQWLSFAKSSSAYDKLTCDRALFFLQEFEKKDPLRRRMLSRCSISLDELDSQKNYPEGKMATIAPGTSTCIEEKDGAMATLAEKEKNAKFEETPEVCEEAVI